MARACAGAAAGQTIGDDLHLRLVQPLVRLSLRDVERHGVGRDVGVGTGGARTTAVRREREIVAGREPEAVPVHDEGVVYHGEVASLEQILRA